MLGKTITGSSVISQATSYMSGDFHIIVSFNRPQEALGDYAQRLQVEICFKAMKSSRFDIEKMHLTDLQRIEELVLLVMVAFVWCCKVGIHLHATIQIRAKKHGMKAKSIFRYGLVYISNYLMNVMSLKEIDIYKFCHVLRNFI